MPKLPVVTGSEAVTALRGDGFVLKRRKSTHITLWHPQKLRAVTVVDHGSQPMRPGTLRSVIRDAGLTVEEFRRLLK